MKLILANMEKLLVSQNALNPDVSTFNTHQFSNKCTYTNSSDLSNYVQLNVLFILAVAANTE